MELIWPIIIIVGASFGVSAIFGKTIGTVVFVALCSFPALWSVTTLAKDFRAGAVTKETFPGWAMRNWLLMLSPVSYAILVMNEVAKFSSFVFAISALVYGVTFAAIYKTALRDLFHGGAGGDDVIRGSRVVDGATLQRQIWQGKPAPELEPMSVGGIEIPPELEMQHFLVGGTNGAGKTQAIESMLRTARRRRNKAIISDTGCGFVSRFWRDGDVILNPFDERSATWSPFAEIKRPYDCPRLANAVIPEGKGDESSWNHYARVLLAEVLLSMWKNGEHSIEKLMYYLTVAGPKELGVLLAGTPAMQAVEKENGKMLGNVRNIISTYMGTWRYLKDGGTFSVRDWVRDESKDNWLYLTMKGSQVAELRALVTTWLELSIVEGLDLSESRDRRLFYVLDELDTLGKMAALRDGATKLRKYGGVIITGLQTIAQLRDTWGRDAAQVLLGNFNTKIIFRAGDAETGKYFEDELGQQEVERVMQNQSFSHGDGDGSTSYNTQRQRQATVMASEITGLPNLSGFIKVPGQDIGTFALQYTKMEEVREGFIEREITSERKQQQAEPVLSIARS